MASRLLPVLVLLVLASSVALAALPCKTEQEAMAEAVTGFFLRQQVAAARCDEELGGKAHGDLDGRLRKAYKAQLAEAAKVREGYFQRAFGPKARKEQAQMESMLTEMLGATLVVNADTCGQLKAELERRIAGGWEPIRERLLRRTRAIPADQQNLCKP